MEYFTLSRSPWNALKETWIPGKEFNRGVYFIWKKNKIWFWFLPIFALSGIFGSSPTTTSDGLKRAKQLTQVQPISNQLTDRFATDLLNIILQQYLTWLTTIWAWSTVFTGLFLDDTVMDCPEITITTARKSYANIKFSLFQIN